MSTLTRPGSRDVLPGWLLRLHRQTHSSLLVLGGMEPDRLAVARAFHDAQPGRSGRLRVVHCGRDPDLLRPALCSWLSLDGGGSPSNPLRASERGTLFLDEVRLLREPEQRLLLALARQLQDGTAPAAGERGPNRLIAGDTEELLAAVRDGRFSAPLLDALDKIRVELSGVLGQGAA